MGLSGLPQDRGFSPWGRPSSPARAPRHAWQSALLAALLAATTLHAQPQPSILHLVDAHYNHLTSLRCRFTERYTGMGMTRSESGSLQLKKPGRMAWLYDSPAGKLFVFDGKFAWFYTPGDPQAQRLPAKQLDDLHTPLRLLLGHTRLEKELTQIQVTQREQDTQITGVPRGMEERIKQLTLRVTPTGAITAMQLEELDGASTSFTFTDPQENLPTPDSVFTFTPPPGVTIITGSPPL